MTEELNDDFLQEFVAGKTAEPSDPHTLLEVWSEVLGNVESSAATPLGFAQTNAVTRSWPEIKVSEVPDYNWAFHSNLLIMRGILRAEIEDDPECFKWTGEGEDAEHNRHHYLNLLTNWQKQMIEWEKTWDRKSADAHVWMAAYAATGEFLLGDKGLVAHLDQIGFEVTEEVAQEIWAAANSVEV